jgi:DNA-binding transcriptional LysR family regulator
VSQQVRELENQLGCALFVRKTRNIGLTPAGERLLPLARKLLADARFAAESVRAVGRSPQGVVRVAASPLVAHTLLVPALGSFAAAHPGIRVGIDVFPADQVVDVYRDDAYDAAISEGRSGAGARDPERLILRTEPVVAAWPAAWPAPKGGGAADVLSDVPLVAWPEESVLGAAIRRGLRAAGVDLEQVHFRAVAGDPLVQAAMAASGFGVAFVPALAAAAELMAGRIAEWRAPGFEVAIDVWALASLKDGAAQTFLAWLAAYGERAEGLPAPGGDRLQAAAGGVPAARDVVVRGA